MDCFTNDTIIGNTGIAWAQATGNRFDTLLQSSYLRPADGGALLPWIYTVVIILVHVPTVVIRVVQWELVQTWNLVFTFFTVALYIQAYVSTRFAPAKILVWTPIILIIDAGSMLQLFFLVIEAERKRVGSRSIILDPPETPWYPPTIDESSSLLLRYQAWKASRKRKARSVSTDSELQSVPMMQKISRQPSRTDDPISKVPSKLKDLRLWVAVLSAAFFIITLILQLVGLAYAIIALKSPDPPPAQWCCPLFQLFGKAIVDGNCNIYEIVQDAQRGLGCITLPGVCQQAWIKATVAVLIIELSFEAADLVILYKVDITQKWNGAKMKRPWLSIFSGMVVLLGTLVCAIFYASSLPPGITERVLVLADIGGPGGYRIRLTPPGLRGTIIGWSDGLFESWGMSYFGT